MDQSCPGLAAGFGKVRRPLRVDRVGAFGLSSARSTAVWAAALNTMAARASCTAARTALAETMSSRAWSAAMISTPSGAAQQRSADLAGCTGDQHSHG